MAGRKATEVGEGLTPFLDLSQGLQNTVLGPDGKTYGMLGDGDASIRDTEILRRVYLKILEAESWEGDEEGLLTGAESTILTNLEVTFCSIVIPDMPEDMIRGLPSFLRSRVIHSFIKTVNQLSFLNRVQTRLTEMQREAAEAKISLLRTHGNATGTTSTSKSDTPSGSPVEAAG